MHRAPVRFGYLAQEAKDLASSRTVLDEAVGANPAVARQDVQNLLGCLLFRGAEAFKPVTALSAGERIRLGLVRLLLKDPDIIVMDEPTNGLDLPSRERLEEALDAYAGALVIASHDRHLLSRLSNTVISIRDSRFKYFPGGYVEFRERQERGDCGAASDRRLVLEARLARLSAALAAAAEGEADRLTAEFMDVSRKLLALRDSADGRSGNDRG